MQANGSNPIQLYPKLFLLLYLCYQMIVGFCKKTSSGAVWIQTAHLYRRTSSSSNGKITWCCLWYLLYRLRLVYFMPVQEASKKQRKSICLLTVVCTGSLWRAALQRGMIIVPISTLIHLTKSVTLCSFYYVQASPPWWYFAHNLSFNNVFSC